MRLQAVHKRWGARLAGAALGAMVSTLPADAQTVADFYSRTPLTLIVGSGVGGGFDLYARLFAPHFARHIPGHPAVVVKNQPGAGGLANMNTMAHTAPRDGSAIAATFNTIALMPLYGDHDAQFDPRQLNWIGSIGKQQAVCVTWKTAPIKTLDDAKKQEVLVSSTGRNSTPAIFPRILNALFGTKFKIISGYSTSEMRLALEKGEVQGICGLAWQTLQSTSASWIAHNDLNVILQMGLVKDRDLPASVPLALDLLSKGEDKTFFRLAALPGEFGRPFVAPPGIPADRLAALRSAFDATMTDRDFIAEATKAQMIVDPLDGRQIQTLLDEAYAAPQPIRDRVAEYFLPVH
ncbi:MAG: tripartite tricarboxylate transporter substrate-binding protein [Xanthobacteraceae bacterium]